MNIQGWFPLGLTGWISLQSRRLSGSMVENLSAREEAWVRSLVGEDSLKKNMAIHSSILAWKILWTEEPGGLQSRGLQSRTWLNDYTTTKLLYKVVFVSAVWQSEPVICRHISPPSWTSLPPEMLSMLLGSRISGSHDNLFNMLKNHLTISVVTTSFLIPVIDWGFQLLHILTVAWMGVWLYLIHIFPLTNDVELFSCAYCPFVYLLRRNIYLDLSLKINLIYHVFLCVCVLSRVQLFVTLWTVAYQAPLPMGFSR